MLTYTTRVQHLRNAIYDATGDDVLADKIITNHAQKLEDCMDINHNFDTADKAELLTVLLQLFAKDDHTSSLMTKEEVLKIVKIPKQKFEAMVRAKLIPHIRISNKIRIFDINEVCRLLGEYRVDELVSSRIPAQDIADFISSYK